MSYLVKNIILGFCFLFAICFIIFASGSLAKYSIYTWLIFIIVLGAIFGWFKKRTNNFASGLIGEDDVAEELKKLPKNFIVKNDFSTGCGNIDKIVIGTTGIWTLEVKSYKGNIVPTKHDLGQAYAEAKTLQVLVKSKLNLYINVQPVLVFSNKYAKVRFGLNKQSGVYVIQKAWLTKLITETHIQDLDNTDMQKIKDILEVV